MIARRCPSLAAIALVASTFALAASSARVVAQPQPRPAAPAPSTTIAAPRPIGALIFNDKDLRQSTLIGPSGQIYEPALTATPAATTAAPSTSAPRWIRRAAGGVSSTVAGAVRLGGELLVSGTQTPMFRYQSGQWMLAQLGQRGRVLYSSGPFFAIAIGRQIFVAGPPPNRAPGQAAKVEIPSVETPATVRLARVGTAPGNVIALWAASETSIYLVTDQGVFRRRGNAFIPALKLPGVVGFSGAVPHALTTDTAINLRTNARVRLTGQLLRIAKSESTPAALLRSPTGAIILARDVTNAARNVDLPPPPAAQLAPPAAPAAAPLLAPTAPTGSPTPAAPAPSPTASPAAPQPSLNALVAVDSAGRALIAAPSAFLIFDGAAWSSGVLADELPPPRTGPGAARSR